MAHGDAVGLKILLLLGSTPDASTNHALISRRKLVSFRMRVLGENVWLRMYRAEALASQDGRCAYCYDPLRHKQATADHVVARKRGGQTAMENIKAACGQCNRLKGSKGEKAFLRWIKNPQRGDGIGIWMAWSRRRINLAAMRACRAITAAVS